MVTKGGRNETIPNYFVGFFTKRDAIPIFFTKRDAIPIFFTKRDAKPGCSVG